MRASVPSVGGLHQVVEFPLSFVLFTILINLFHMEDRVAPKGGVGGVGG